MIGSLTGRGQYAEIMYGVKQDADEVEQSGEEDIEVAVQRELDSIKAERGDSATRLFTPVKLNVDCLLFVKTKPPVEPVAFVKRICEDASGSKNMKSRYVNRLTPVAESGKATEQGLLGVARKVLSPWFDLSGKKVGSEPTTAEPHKSDEESKSAAEQPAEGSDEASKDGEGPGDKSAGDPVQDVGGVEVAQSYSVRALKLRVPFSCSLQKQFAIRPSVRSNSALKRDIVINQIAALINNERHKVNLKAPDKVILVDVYQVTLQKLEPGPYLLLRVGLLTETQNVCGMSVVDGDWEDLKRYNLSELYTLGSK